MPSGQNEKRLYQNGEFWRSLFSCIRIDKMQGIEGEATPPFIFTRGFPPSFHYDPLYPPRNGREYFIRYGTENVGYL